MGGSADCDGLQGERVAWMSCVMPGQKMDDSAFEIILAAWSLKEGGITMYITTPSRWFRYSVVGRS